MNRRSLWPESVSGMFFSRSERGGNGLLTDISFFGPNNNPLLQVGYRGMVEVDAGFNIRLVSLHDYEKTVGHLTWKAVKHYASDLQDRKVKIAFFSATPQGGGVALMRHALVRFCHELGVDARW